MTKQVKVGDKVRIISNAFSTTRQGIAHYFAIGSVVTVKSSEKDGTLIAEGTVTSDHPNEGEIETQYLREEHYELITPAIDFTKPVQTKDGRPLEIVTIRGRGDYPVIGFIGDSTAPSTFTADGKFFLGLENNNEDLENVPAKPVEIVRYFNIYEDFVMGHDTRAEADAGAEADRIGCKRVVFTGDEYDD